MRDEHGVSEVLGYSLVFSLVLVSVAIVSVGGLSGFQNVETFERQSNAQKAFDVMHNNIEDVYYQGAPSRGTEIDLGDTRLQFDDPVVINVTVDDGSRDEFIVRSHPLVQDFGNGDGHLVYEAGAVFQTSQEGGTVRRHPPMTLRTGTANLIVPNVSQPDTRSVGSGTVLIRARSNGQDLLYRNTSRDPSAQLTVNVTSPRADLWERYLTSRGAFSDGDCTRPRDDRVVCGPVTQQEIYVVESDITILFDR